MATIDLPLLRVPVSVIIDDSAPCVNLGYYWLEQREAWMNRHRPGGIPEEDRLRFEKNRANFRAIPAEFARRFGEWCLDAGVKGKFSLIPCPAHLGRIDERLEGHSGAELDAWLRAAKEVLWKNWDLTPEMLTHTFVVDLKTWRPTEAWEQYEWAFPVHEPLLTEYIAKSLELLRRVGIPCEGVTSPGGFGGKMEETYARATLNACRQVNGTPRPYYFKRIYLDKPPEVPVLLGDAERGTAVMSIIACTGDWFGGWTGFDVGDVDRFLTPDGRGGRLPEVIAQRRPAVMCGHWPGFYQNGEELGFKVLQEIKRRLDEHYAADVLWMKVSEITDYECTRALARVESSDTGRGARVKVRNAFAVPRFTLRVPNLRATRVACGGKAFDRARERAGLAEGGFVHDGADTVLALRLPAGETAVELER
ncbi:MAG: hypothetical protein M5U26_13635 [Planctomycetota bacterium]|nr:hypothetical protein [Planctomycetota bacterium]